MTTARRRRVATILVLAFGVGLLLTTFAEKGSGLYDVGTMVLLACLTIGSFVVLYFAKKRAPILAKPPSFAPGTPFVAHLRVRIAGVNGGRASATPIALGAERYFLLIGSEGFSARFRAQADTRDLFEAQLLLPEEALAKFPEGMVFRVFDGTGIVAEGVVAERVAGIESAPPRAQADAEGSHEHRA